MKRRNILYALVALPMFLLVSAELHSSDTAGTSAALLAMDQKRVDAQIQGDLVTLDPFLGDDLSYVHASGLLQTKTEFLADLKGGKRQYKSIKNSELVLRMLQGAAVITGRSEIDVVTDGKEISLSVRITEVYAKRGMRWQLIAYQSTSVKP